MSISAIFMPVINDGKKVVKMLCIYYLVRFQEKQIKTLLDSGSEVNAINPNYTWKLRLKIWKTNVKAQKIDGSTLEIFGMVIADFQMEDKASRPRFFQKIFLVLNTKFKVILGILFLKISNINVSFGEETLT